VQPNPWGDFNTVLAEHQHHQAQKFFVENGHVCRSLGMNVAVD
jgi:hypothetical protein